ncbi:MAG: C_GCAxxG_C_C family protein [Phycisphaerae bacterium]|nr:C_GCAxxG_C_C family protein [Phycisphaerae bacterium]
MLHWAGMLILGGFAARTAQSEQKNEATFAGLTEKDHVDIDKPCADIIQMAYQLGHDYESRHGGCCRCTVAALQKAIGFVPGDRGLFRAASCLDGGATPNGIQNCGAFTGAGMFIGWTCGLETFGNTGLSHRLMREVFQRFQQEYGSVLCKDVRERAGRDCPEVVGRAARWTAEVLLRQFAKAGPEQHL